MRAFHNNCAQTYFKLNDFQIVPCAGVMILLLVSDPFGRPKRKVICMGIGHTNSILRRIDTNVPISNQCNPTLLGLITNPDSRKVTKNLPFCRGITALTA